jgi:hypothetical protein
MEDEWQLHTARTDHLCGTRLVVVVERVSLSFFLGLR